MKTLIILVLSCTSMFGADTSVQVVTAAKTNAASGSIFTMDVFMRDGRTNLMRTTMTRRGVTESQHCRFYHNGVLTGEYWTMPDSSGFITEAGSPYSVIVRFGPTKEVGDAFICSKDRVVLDYFIATNGFFYPADGSALRKANAITTKMSEIIQSFPQK